MFYDVYEGIEPKAKGSSMSSIRATNVIMDTHYIAYNDEFGVLRKLIKLC
jgi:hypothetical protein